MKNQILSSLLSDSVEFIYMDKFIKLYTFQNYVKFMNMGKNNETFHTFTAVYMFTPPDCFSRKRGVITFA